MAAGQVGGQKTRIRLLHPISFDDSGDPIHVKVSTVDTLSFVVMGDWAQDALAKGSEVGWMHQPVIFKGRHRQDLPDSCWIELRDP